MKTYRQLMEDVSNSVDLRPQQLLGRNLTTPINSPDAFFQQRGIVKSGTGLIDRGKMAGGDLLNVAKNNAGAIGGVAAAGIGAALFRPALDTIGKIFGKKDPKPQDTFQKDYDDKRQITKDNIEKSMQTAKAVTSQKPKKIGGNRRTDNKPGAGVSAPLTKLG